MMKLFKSKKNLRKRDQQILLQREKGQRKIKYNPPKKFTKKKFQFTWQKQSRSNQVQASKDGKKNNGKQSRPKKYPNLKKRISIAMKFKSPKINQLFSS